jgi:hypothetical protein
MSAIRISCTAADTLSIDRLSDLQGNLKKISAPNLDRLKRSILKHGFTAPVFVWIAGKHKRYILDGHQRIKALRSLEADGYEIPDLPVAYIEAKTKKEAREKLLYITSQYGDFTTEGITDYIQGLDTDLSDVRLADDEVDIARILERIGETEDGVYTKRIIAPVYEPKNEPPPITELVDTKKADALIERIMASNISDGEKTFLIWGAYRHLVFDYGKIADYYAHASPEVQELMEESALVIIDFDKAVENGFIRLSKDLAALYAKD